MMLFFLHIWPLSFLFIFGFCNGFALTKCKFRFIVACITCFSLKLCVRLIDSKA